MNKKVLISLGIFALIGVSAFFLFSKTINGPTEPSPENVVTESDDKSSLIRNVNVKPGDLIESPLVIEGEARGFWYFEASFPIVLVNWDGLIIAEGFATAQDEWMTEDFVPFEATLEFTKPSYGDTGALILQKDNPSDLPEFDDALEIPIKFN